MHGRMRSLERPASKRAHPVDGYVQVLRSFGTAQRKNMTSIPDGDQEQCPRCGSKLVNIEWEERVNAQEVQTLRHCLNCSNEFVSLEASKEEQPASDAEVTKPFFTSLVIE
jgi:DNA-directed RNA polymerase subunit RPC12/RpoP